MIPFGKANVLREGRDLTIVTYGSTVVRSLQAAERLAREDQLSVEVIDLRSLSPYDWPAIERSVEKTSRVLVVYEDWLSWGYGAEIAARIADELFSSLDAPVRRFGGAGLLLCLQSGPRRCHPAAGADIAAAVLDLMAF